MVISYFSRLRQLNCGLKESSELTTYVGNILKPSASIVSFRDTILIVKGLRSSWLASQSATYVLYRRRRIHALLLLISLDAIEVEIEG